MQSSTNYPSINIDDLSPEQRNNVYKLNSQLAAVFAQQVVQYFPEAEAELREKVKTFSMYQGINFEELRNLLYANPPAAKEGVNGFIVIAMENGDPESPGAVVAIGVADPSLVQGRPWKLGALFQARHKNCDLIIGGSGASRYLSDTGSGWISRVGPAFSQNNNLNVNQKEFNVQFLEEVHRTDFQRLSEFSSLMEQVFDTQSPLVRKEWSNSLNSAWSVVGWSMVGQGAPPSSVLAQEIVSKNLAYVVSVATENFRLLIGTQLCCKRNWAVATELWAQEGNLLAEKVRGGGVDVSLHGSDAYWEARRILFTSNSSSVREVGFRLDLEHLGPKLGFNADTDGVSDIESLAGWLESADSDAGDTARQGDFQAL